jgi:hypothetical protein
MDLQVCEPAHDAATVDVSLGSDLGNERVVDSRKGRRRRLRGYGGRGAACGVCRHPHGLREAVTGRQNPGKVVAVTIRI